MFDKYDMYSGVTCNITGFLYIFGISNMIYFTPSGAIASGSVSMQISNLINPGFSNSAPFVINGIFYYLN